MRKTKPAGIHPFTVLLMGMAFAGLMILFVGIRRDREYWEADTFIKYRPTLQLEFTSGGESDPEDLSPAVRAKDERFHEFVEVHRLPDLSPLLLQATLTLLCFGIIAGAARQRIPPKRMLLHVLACGIVGSVPGLRLFLYFYDEWYAALIGFAILLLNVLYARHLIRKRQRKEERTQGSQDPQQATSSP